MIDPQQREVWFKEYLRAAVKFASRFEHPSQVSAWARSMSLIAEQFIDNDDREPVERLEPT